MPSKPDANFIWSIANLLRGPYKPKEYGDVVLPFTILRRLDCVLAPTKDAVLAEQKRSGDRTAKDLLDVKLRRAAKFSFYNTSPYTLPSLTGDSANIKANLLSYVDGFSDNVRDWDAQAAAFAAGLDCSDPSISSDTVGCTNTALR